MTHSSKIKVLIAHGDPLIAAGLVVTLQKQRDFEASICRPASKLSSATASDLPPADVVVADYETAMRLIPSAGAASHRVVILTHSDGEARICHALEQGARGYLLLGCGLQDLFDSLRAVRVGGMALGPLVASRVAEWMKQRALTPREGDILRQMMLGRSNKRIAIELSVAVGTVKTHVKSILEKLDAASRTEAVAIAQRRGILQEEREHPPSASSVARIGARSGRREPSGAVATSAGAALVYSTRVLDAAHNYPSAALPGVSLQLEGRGRECLSFRKLNEARSPGSAPRTRLTTTTVRSLRALRRRRECGRLRGARIRKPQDSG